MKKTAITTLSVFAALTLLALSGCSGVTSGGSATSGSTTGSQTTGAVKGPWKIGYSTFFEGNSWQAQNVQLFEKECKALGAKVSACTVQNANSSTSAQIAQIQGMINQGYNAILLDANSATGLNNVVKTALDKGVRVVNFDTTITGPATSKINTNQVEWGAITGKWLVDQLHGKGNIIVLNGAAGQPTGVARYQDAKALFAKTPGIKIVASAYANWDQATAQTAVAQMLNANPEIDGVWSQGGAMTAGAIIEFQKAHRKLVPMTGEAYNGLLKLWLANKDNGFTSIAPGQPNYLVQVSLAAAVKSLEGKSVPAAVNVPLPVITDKTVQDYVQPNKPDSYWVLNNLSTAKVDALLAAK